MKIVRPLSDMSEEELLETIRSLRARRSTTALEAKIKKGAKKERRINEVDEVFLNLIRPALGGTK